MRGGSTRSTSSSTRWSTRAPAATRPISGPLSRHRKNLSPPHAGRALTTRRRASAKNWWPCSPTSESAMLISTLRDEVQTTLVDFAWSQWAQMGVFASTDRRDTWAQDPEALLVFTLHIARREPRLFDEVLD